ncbi:MAG: ribosome maturation factor RimM [Hydrogenophilaceae bacterium]|nr:ribosome maturation factor RimM [Hydrogenophilaceae bacterium]
MGDPQAPRVVMGRIAGPYGIKGWVRIQPFTETLDALLDYPVWQIGSQDNWQEAEIEEAGIRGQSIIAKLAGCNDRDAAFALRGQEIAVFRDELPEPEDNEYYWEDLIGLTVVNREGVELGHVVKLLETGAHDVLVVKNEKEHLIPFVGVYVLNVDLAQGIIEVDWGLDY